MKELEKLVLKRIDEIRDEIIKFHQQIIQIPSETPPGKYKEVANFTERKMKEIGLKTQLKRKNVIGELGEEDGKILIFNGHYDTVQVFKNWTRDPFGGEIEDGKIYGRGACDDKSCVTAEIFATQALIEVGAKLKGKLIVTAVGDEELGGLKGAKLLLSSGVINGDACLLGDGPSDFPIGYTGGTMYVTFTINGKTGHGLDNPDVPSPFRNNYSGINSIEKMLRIMNFLVELNKEFLKVETNYPLIADSSNKISWVNLAEIRGGTKISTVPDKCYLHCSVNLIPEQDTESIKKRILDFVENLKEKDPDLEVKVQIPISMEPFVIDGKSDFAQAVKRSSEIIHNDEIEFKLMMPSTDAHWFQEREIVTIIIGTGRGDNNCHAADEFVYIEDLINTTKLYALTALNYLK